MLLMGGNLFLPGIHQLRSPVWFSCHFGSLAKRLHGVLAHQKPQDLSAPVE